MPRRMDLRMMRDMARNSRGMRGRDGRNPYGSSGGYVSSRRPRRDRAMNEDMARGMSRGSRSGNRGSNDYGSYSAEYDSRMDYDYATGEYNTRDSVYGRELYGYYGDTPFEIKRGYSMRDSEMDYARGGRGRDRGMDYAGDYERNRDMNYDYARGGRRDYGNDYRMDYGEDETTLSKEELEDWVEELTEKFDAREKEMFKKDKVMKRAEDLGVKFDHFKPEEYYATAVMLYKDYKKTLGSANADIYLKLAKDWLMDDDVEMKHGEKLAAYYDNVVMAE